MFRYFFNTQNIPLIIVLLRLRNLDPQANVTRGKVIAPLSIPLTEDEVIYTDSILSDSQITSLLSTPQSAEESSILQSFLDATTGFNNLPDWATDTAQQAADRITNAIFNGQTLAQVQTSIDNLPNSFPGMKTGLKQAADAIITIRAILTNIAKAVVFLRDYVIKTHR